MTHGNWIVLENCHLDIELTLRLCVQFQDGIDAENVHDEFRLWCVTAPTNEFPIAVLRHAVKFTCNPANNLKEIMLKHVAQLNDEKHLRWSFALVTFHAVLQERRTFGASGWSRPYAFNDHSLLQTLTCLRSLVKTVDDSTSFDGIAYLVTECFYGGLVVDHVDRRLLRSLFQQICCNTTANFFESGNICIPAELTIDNCVKAIDVLSSHRQTAAIDVGLHANCEFERGFLQCDYILSMLSQSAPADTNDSSVDAVQMISNDILSRLPTPLPVIGATADDTFGLIRRFEATHLNDLLQCVQSTLTELNQAIDGHIHMIDDLHNIYRSIRSNRIPSAWLPFIYRTSKSLASFIADLIARVAFFRRWHNDGPPERFWFAAFHKPEALVTGMREMYAIAHHIDLDDVCIQCIVSVQHAHTESIVIEVSVPAWKFHNSV